MKSKSLFSLLFLTFSVFIISFIYQGCSDFKNSRLGTEGELCFGNGTCKSGLKCVSGICKDENAVATDEDSENIDLDSGDTGNTTDDHDSGNTGNSGDTGNTGNSGNSGNTGDTGNTGNSGNSGNTLDADTVTDEDKNDDPTDDDIQISECVKLNNPCNDSGDVSAECVDLMTNYDCNCSTNYTDNGTTCIADTRIDQPCTGLPANAQWNTVSTISQTWNGLAWSPGTAGYYNETATTTGCHFN